MLARMARRASLTLRKRRLSTRFDAGSLNSHLPRESVSSVNYGDERIGKAHFLQSFSSLPLNHLRRDVVIYKRKYVHEVLVNSLFKLAQKKVELGELTVRP